MAAQSKKTNVPSKMCLVCGLVKPLGDFYPNKQWLAQYGRDVWCKECVQDKCKDVDSLREYFWYNNRAYSEQIWEKATEKGLYHLAKNPSFINPKTTKSHKDKQQREMTAKQALGIMNSPALYVYSENIKEGEPIQPFNPKSSEGTLDKRTMKSMNDEEEKVIYSDSWNGHYTLREIAYLDKYYEEQEEGFVLDNRNIQDYARKVAKASLDVDIISDKRRRGLATMEDLARAQQMFDKLSQAAAFAACKRQNVQSSGLGSLGEIIEQIEITGAIQKVKAEFEPDDIDKILSDFLHTLEAVGIGGAS